MEKFKAAIIGAGVIGLAVARELSKGSGSIVLLEKNSSFGEEASSRNSEVIHAGIYYPKDSLKAITCLRGKELLYEYCKKHNIAHKRTGKLIVAAKANEAKDLESLFENAKANGLKDLRILNKGEIKKIEPDIEAEAAIDSPSTGIIDTHSFMKSLSLQAKARSVEIAYDSEVVAIEKSSQGFEITVSHPQEGNFSFLSDVMINCAGLYCDKISQMAGIDEPGYKLHYCKGDYFRVHNNKARFIKKLIYPVPTAKRSGLGIHATLDLGGGLRLGPDDEYVDSIKYDIDEKKKTSFYENVKNFLPFVAPEDLGPDTSGIRPKLSGPGESFRDFIIKDESDKGFPGFINLIGIESPGLTACLAIAEKANEIAVNYL